MLSLNRPVSLGSAHGASDSWGAQHPDELSEPVGPLLLAFPHHRSIPTHGFELGDVLGVTPPVRPEFRLPIVSSGLGYAAPRAPFVRVPKASMHEDRYTAAPKNKVRLAGEVSCIHAEPVPSGMQL